METLGNAADAAAAQFDPLLIVAGALAGVAAVVISAIVLRAAWVHLGPELAEILEPALRRLGRGYTRRVHGGNGMGAPWLCVPCRSYNDGRHVHCYRCGAARPDVEGPPPAIN